MSKTPKAMIKFKFAGKYNFRQQVFKNSSKLLINLKVDACISLRENVLLIHCCV
jgi:hypothetical protein